MNFPEKTGSHCFDHKVLVLIEEQCTCELIHNYNGAKNSRQFFTKRIQSFKLDLCIHQSITLTQLEVQTIFQRIFTSDKVQKSPHTTMLRLQE